MFKVAINLGVLVSTYAYFTLYFLDSLVVLKTQNKAFKLREWREGVNLLFLNHTYILA